MFWHDTLDHKVLVENCFEGTYVLISKTPCITFDMIKRNYKLFMLYSVSNTFFLTEHINILFFNRIQKRTILRLDASSYLYGSIKNHAENFVAAQTTFILSRRCLLASKCNTRKINQSVKRSAFGVAFLAIKNLSLHEPNPL